MRRREAAAGLALALAVLTWQGAIYWGAIVALSLVLECLRTRRSVLRAAAWTLGLRGDRLRARPRRRGSARCGSR